MKTIQEPNQCQHEVCNCPLPEGGNYCSEYCENAANGDTGGGCECGHSECV